MKKLTLILIIALSIVSCKKDEIPKDCNCGVITRVISFDDSNLIFYEIQNDCSGNKQEFMRALASNKIDHVGNIVCIGKSW